MVRLRNTTVLLVALVGMACESGAGPAGSLTTEFPVPSGDWTQVVPAGNLPAGVTTYVSNNNLDVVLLDGSVYLAFRTAPSHFAGEDTLIHVIRDDTPETPGPWEYELTLYTGKDLREPRMFVMNGSIFLYVSELGTDLTTFDPGRVFAVARDPGGTWGKSRDVFLDGTIVWRTKVRNGQVYMTGYRGGENIYQDRDNSGGLEILFMTTNDGWNWTGVDPEKPVVLTGGVSETGFEFTDSGDLYAVLRNESGDVNGFGSRLCWAAAEALGQWDCKPGNDPHKYDSPFMFRYQDFLYLIARYNPSGPFDTAPGEPATDERFNLNQTRYSTTTKRTALYGYDTAQPAIVPLDILPSNGDTAFASGVWLDDDRLLVFNYSSDFSGPDMAWIEGQFVGSQIYSAILDFSDLKR